MNLQSEIRAWALAIAGVFALSAIGYRVLTLPKLPDLAPTLQRANAALDTINRPCGKTPCGTLANVDKLVVKIGDIAVDTQTQVRQSGTLINAASQSLASTSQHLDAAVDTANSQLKHLGPLLDSVRASSDAIPPVLQHITGDADALSANADGGVTDFRRFLQAPALTGTLSNAASMTGSWAAISVDARKVADKETADFLKPVPWYLKPLKKGGEIIDITAAVARHAP